LPIIYIICGVFLILLMFDVIRFDNLKKKFGITVSLIFFVFSFFIDNLMVFDIYFNTFEIVSLLFLLSILVDKNSCTFISLVIIVLCCSIYFVLLHFSVINLSNNYIMFICFSLFSGLVYRFKLFNVLIAGIINIFINCKFQIVEYTFSILDFNIFYELIFIYCLLYLILTYFKSVKGRVFNVQKINFISNYNGVDFSNYYNE